MELKYDNLLNKEWVINKQDCFTLGRDFFIQNFDIHVPDFARPLFWEADKLDLIRLMFPRAGFKMVEEDWNDLRPGDVLAMACSSTNANHLAVYIGNTEIIHHRIGMNSCKETLRPYWRMSTLFTLRHPDVPDLRPELATISIEELIRGRFKREAT